MNIKKTILLMKKVPVWLIVTSVLLVTVIAIALGTNQKNAQETASVFIMDLYTVSIKEVENFKSILNLNPLEAKNLYDEIQINDEILKSLMTDDAYENLLKNRENLKFTEICYRKNYTMQVAEIQLSENKTDNKNIEAAYDFQAQIKLISDSKEIAGTAKGSLELGKTGGNWKITGYRYILPDVLGELLKDNTYPLEFIQISNTNIENLQFDNINKIIEEKINDKGLSAFIFTDNENNEFKGGISLNGKSYYIGKVSMENTPVDLMGIEEVQAFGKKTVKIYGILGTNYAQAFYWFVEEKPEDSIMQIDGNTVEIDIDDDDKKEIISTLGTIPETRIYILKKGRIYVSDINKSIGAQSVTLQDKDKKIFEVYFEPNKPEQYIFYEDSFKQI